MFWGGLGYSQSYRMMHETQRDSQRKLTICMDDFLNVRYEHAEVYSRCLIDFQNSKQFSVK